MKLEGGCYCGKVRYVAEGDPMFKGQCHCRECQYISGGGPNYFMLMPIKGSAMRKASPRNLPAAILRTPSRANFAASAAPT